MLGLIKSIEMYCVLGRAISVFCTLCSLFPRLLSQDFSRFLYTRGKAFFENHNPCLYGQLQATIKLLFRWYEGDHQNFYRLFGVNSKCLKETYIFCPSKNHLEGINRLS